MGKSKSRMKMTLVFGKQKSKPTALLICKKRKKRKRETCETWKEVIDLSESMLIKVGAREADNGSPTNEPW